MDLKLEHSEEEIKEIYNKKVDKLPGIDADQFVLMFCAMQSYYRHEVGNVIHSHNLMKEVLKRTRLDLDKYKAQIDELKKVG